MLARGTHNEWMPLPIPRPSAVFDLTRAAVGQAMDSAGTLAAVPARAFAVLDSVEALVNRINTVIDRVETVLDRAERAVENVEQTIGEVKTITTTAAATVTEVTRIATTAGEVLSDVQTVAGSAAVLVAEAESVATAAGVVVGEAEAVASKAAGVVSQVEGTAATAGELLTTYAPTLRKAAPMAVRFVEQLSPEEVDAAIRLVDELPRLTEHLTADVLPILATLDRVGPDIHDLLEVTRDLNLAVAGIPGLRMLKRRGEEKLS